MINGIRGTGKLIEGKVELEITEGDFKGVTFFYDKMKFADEPNDDGTIGMSFDYEITSGFQTTNETKPVFETLIGDSLMAILEQQIKKDEVVYSGGTDEQI